MIFRAIKGLTDHISVSVVHPDMLGDGWTFSTDFDGATGDTLYGLPFARDVYLKDTPDMTGRVTVPILWDMAKLLEKAGAKSIRAAVSHSLLTEQGIDRLKGSPICELVTTDTVPQREWTSFNVTVLSVADTLAEAICRIHNDQSVSSLFRV